MLISINSTSLRNESRQAYQRKSALPILWTGITRKNEDAGMQTQKTHITLAGEEFGMVSVLGLEPRTV